MGKKQVNQCGHHLLHGQIIVLAPTLIDCVKPTAGGTEFDNWCMVLQSGGITNISVFLHSSKHFC